MRRSIYFHPAALEDVEEAASWYAARSVRAANRFLDELDRVIDQITAAPSRFADFEENLRRAVFWRFPFYLVFRAEESEVVVIALAHAKRRPRFWLDRV